MTRKARLSTTLTVLGGLALGPGSGGLAGADSCIDPDSQWCTYEDTVDVRLKDLTFVRVPRNPSPKEYLYTSSCFIENEVRTVDGCIDGRIPEPPESCTSGTWVQPRWARLRDSGDGTPGPWTLEAGYTCPGDPEFPLTVEDFRRLLIEPAPLTLQPGTGWVYAGLETVAYSDDAPRGFSIELLGRQFDIGVFPVEFSWDFGDGSEPIVTEEPGKPWPDHTVSHVYAAAGTVTPVLTTTWKGVFRTNAIAGWTDIPGTGQTTTTGTPITVHTARTRLVEDRLDQRAAFYSPSTPRSSSLSASRRDLAAARAVVTSSSEASGSSGWTTSR